VVAATEVSAAVMAPAVVAATEVSAAVMAPAVVAATEVVVTMAAVVVTVMTVMTCGLVGIGSKSPRRPVGVHIPNPGTGSPLGRTPPVCPQQYHATQCDRSDYDHDDDEHAHLNSPVGKRLGRTTVSPRPCRGHALEPLLRNLLRR
jgi:hypothetical protein